MKILLVLFLLCLSVISISAQEDNEFWDRVNVGVWVGPLFPAGEETDSYNLSTGYYVGVDARYQLFRFMAVGMSVGRNAWSGDVTYEHFDFGMTENATDISSSKTNVCLSLHFGPSAPSWKDFTSLDTDISDVRPYPPGMIVPFFIFEIGPYFWNWTEENDSGEFDESGSGTIVRGTVAGFYQMTKLFSLTAGLSYTLYDFDGDFSATGIFAGCRVNIGALSKE